MAGGWAKDGAVQEQIDASIADAVAQNYMIYIGAAAGVTIVLGIIGFFIGKATG